MRVRGELARCLLAQPAYKGGHKVGEDSVISYIYFKWANNESRHEVVWSECYFNLPREGSLTVVSGRYLSSILPFFKIHLFVRINVLSDAIFFFYLTCE